MQIQVFYVFRHELEWLSPESKSTPTGVQVDWGHHRIMTSELLKWPLVDFNRTPMGLPVLQSDSNVVLVVPSDSTGTPLGLLGLPVDSNGIGGGV